MRGSTLDVYRGQILTTNVDPRAVKVNIGMDYQSTILVNAYYYSKCAMCCMKAAMELKGLIQRRSNAETDHLMLNQCCLTLSAWGPSLYVGIDSDL